MEIKNVSKYEIKKCNIKNIVAHNFETLIMIMMRLEAVIYLYAAFYMECHQNKISLSVFGKYVHISTDEEDITLF